MLLKIIPSTAGYPLRVIAICLPFVYAKTPGGETVTIDTRRTQLVKLHRKTQRRSGNNCAMSQNNNHRRQTLDAGARRPGNRLQPGRSGFDSHRRL